MKRCSTEWIQVADLVTGRLLHVGMVRMMSGKTGGQLNSQNCCSFPINYPFQRLTLSHGKTLPLKCAQENHSGGSFYGIMRLMEDTRHVACVLSSDPSKIMVKVDPKPTWLSTDIRPSCASTIAFVIERPIPLPSILTWLRALSTR